MRMQASWAVKLARAREGLLVHKVTHLAFCLIGADSNSVNHDMRNLSLDDQSG